MAADTRLVLINKNVFAGSENVLRESMLLPRFGCEERPVDRGNLRALATLQARQTGTRHIRTCRCRGTMQEVQSTSTMEVGAADAVEQR